MINSRLTKYGVFSGPCFPVFGLNTEIYGENTDKKKKTYLDTFYAVRLLMNDNFFQMKPISSNMICSKHIK